MLGKTLRQAREARQLSLSEIEWATRIKSAYLHALEEEDYGKLPGAVYARGFLRGYAQYLGVDPNPLIAEYNATETTATAIVSTRPPVSMQRTRFVITPTLLIGVAMIVAAALFLFYVKRQFDHAQALNNGNQVPGVALSPAVILSPTPPVPVSPTPAFNGVEVVVRVDSPVWLKVDIDGKPADVSGPGGKTFPAGSYTFQGQQSVHIRSGKAGHTLITLNGHDLGAMPATEPGGIGDQTYTKGQH